jgi:hypothetical protein
MAAKCWFELVLGYVTTGSGTALRNCRACYSRNARKSYPHRENPHRANPVRWAARPGGYVARPLLVGCM